MTDHDPLIGALAVSPSDPAADPSGTPSRDQVITARAEQGEDFTAIGLDYAISRERVRQIVSDTSQMSNEEIREARRVRRAGARENREAVQVAHVREIAEANPEATMSALVTLSGHRMSVVRQALDWTERERRADPQQYPSAPDEAVLSEVKRVAELDGGKPLTGSFYDEHRTGGVSHARLLQRFGTWTAACDAAGVVGRRPNPGRTYTRNWTEAEMIGWVWNYLGDTDRPSYARFEMWLREQSQAPSAQTIRNTLGSWVEMKRRAIDVHATPAFSH